MPRKQVKKRCLGNSGNSCVRHAACHKNHVWVRDFIHDRDERGRPLKWLSVVDEYTRECLPLDVRRSIKALDVVDLVSEVMLIRGMPKCIRSDNGPEFIAETIENFLDKTDADTLYIKPGSPCKNGYAEVFFFDLRDAQALGASWQSEHNQLRPHSSLDYQTPAEYAAGLETEHKPKLQADPPVGAVSLPAAPPATQPLTNTLITCGP